MPKNRCCQNLSPRIWEKVQNFKYSIIQNMLGDTRSQLKQEAAFPFRVSDQ